MLNGDAESAVHLACRYGYRDVLELLLKANADPCCKNIHQSSPLIVAIQNNKLNCIRVLKRYKVKFNHFTPEKSPLLYAIKQQNVEIVKYILQQDINIRNQKDAWMYARKYHDIARTIMAHASTDFDTVTDKESKFLIKFSNPWDLEKAKAEEIDIKKLVDLMRQCLQQKIQENRKKAKSAEFKIAPHPDTQLTIKLNFLKNPSLKKRAEFSLTDHMIAVLKSELKPKGAAKLIGSGISFKKLAKLITSGGKMVHMNRLLENETLTTEETAKLLQSDGDVSAVITRMATVGNAKLLFQLMSNQTDPILMGQAVKVRVQTICVKLYISLESLIK